MKTIPLSRGLFAEVDDSDFDWLSEFNWYALDAGKGRFYARTHFYFTGRTRTIYMHRLVALPLPIEDIDHIDGNGLNNCRSNLRSCSDAQNQMNQKLSKRNTSGFKGVSWDAGNEKWHAAKRIYGKVHFIGEFNDKLVAALAYDEFVTANCGPFATTNQSLGLLGQAAQPKALTE